MPHTEMRNPIINKKMLFIAVFSGFMFATLISCNKHKAPAKNPIAFNVRLSFSDPDSIATKKVIGPLQKELSKINGVSKTSSSSNEKGFYDIKVELNAGQDADRTGVDIQNRVALIQDQLPKGAGVTFYQIPANPVVVEIRTRYAGADSILVRSNIAGSLRAEIFKVKGVSTIATPIKKGAGFLRVEVYNNNSVDSTIAEIRKIVSLENTKPVTGAKEKIALTVLRPK